MCRVTELLKKCTRKHQKHREEYFCASKQKLKKAHLGGIFAVKSTYAVKRHGTTDK